MALKYLRSKKKKKLKNIKEKNKKKNLGLFDMKFQTEV